MKPFLHGLAAELRQLNTVISSRLDSRVPLVEEIGEHLIAAGGKRLRPLLAIITASCNDDRPTATFELAAVIEFLHTATLLHDDVIDVSSLRRGQPTANETWGNASSVLVGDFLYSRAFQMLVEIGIMPIMAELAETTNLIAEGEVLQLTKAGDASTTEQDYLLVIHYKTARLFEAAAKCGAIAANTPTDQQNAFAEYGYNLGMAFQLMDDVLDYSGDASVMGKNVGDDLSEGKPTLPLIHALLNADNNEAAVIRHAIENKTNRNIKQVTETVLATGSLDYTIKKAEAYSQKAINCIAGLPDSNSKTQLGTLSRLAVQRQA